MVLSKANKKSPIDIANILILFAPRLINIKTFDVIFIVTVSSIYIQFFMT